MSTYVSVVKDANGNWYIKNTITSVYNVRGNKTGNTYGDISKLDDATRIDEGFWIENDVYINNVEFTIFNGITYTYDEVNGIVTYNYNFILMPLSDIKTELQNRVQNYLNTMFCGTITFNSTSVVISYQLRNMLYAINSTNFPANLVVPIGNYKYLSIPDISTLTSLNDAISTYTVGIMQTAQSIYAALDAATTYDELRTAATWNGTQL